MKPTSEKPAYFDIVSLAQQFRRAVEGNSLGYIEEDGPLENLGLAGFRHMAKVALRNLQDLAAKGNHIAAANLVDILGESVQEFVKICTSHPEMFVERASYEGSWPGMLSPFRERQQANVALLGKLRLATKCGINIRGKQAGDTPEVRAAIYLYRCVQHRQRFPLAPGRFTYGRGRSRISGTNDPAQVKASELAAKLQPLNRANYQDWWKAAECLLARKYGDDFENHKAFSHYWKNAAYKDAPKARALIRRDIKKNIRQAFRSVAPKSSPVC